MNRVALSSAVCLAAAATYLGSTIHRSQEVLGSTPIRLAGVVETEEIVVSAELPGRVTRMLVEEGGAVRTGDLLATLDREQEQAKVRYQQARITQLETRLRQTIEIASLEGRRQANQLARAEANLAAARSELDEVITRSKQQQAEQARADQLGSNGLLARQEWERAGAERDAWKSRVRLSEDRVAAARAELELARSNQRQVEVASEDVALTRSQIEQERALLAQAELDLKRTEVRSPRAGVVSRRVATAGETVRAGEPLLTLIDLGDLRVVTHVEESLASRFRLGDAVRLDLPSGEQTEAHVTMISPEAAFATQRDVDRVRRDVRTFVVKARLRDTTRRVHPGMTAYVTIPPAR